MPVRRALTTLAALLAIVCAAAIFQGCGRAENNDPRPSSDLNIVTGGVIADGHQGILYGPLVFQATGGVPPYVNWALVDGSLPPGMDFNNVGVLEGAPQATGTYIFTVQVTDTAGFTSKKDIRLLVVFP